MKIKSMTATFGRLERARLEPGPGLNLLHAPNEGGKSTWAAFWRAMLYGIDTRERDKKGYLADKNRYQPWSGAPMEGEITLEYGKRDITIRRGPRGSTPFGSFSAVYTKTQQPVPGLTASNCGELLTGVGAEVFSRSAFLGDGNLSLTTAPELERRIAALVTSGEEDTSYTEAVEALKKQLNRRRHNKTGQLPALEAELQETEAQLASQAELTRQRENLLARSAELEARESSLKEELAALDRWEAHRKRQDLQRVEDAALQAEEKAAALRRRLEEERVPENDVTVRLRGAIVNLNTVRKSAEKAQEAYDASKSALAQAEEKLSASPFAGQTAEEARQSAQTLPPTSLKAWNWLMLVLAAGLLAAAGWGYYSGMDGTGPLQGVTYLPLAPLLLGAAALVLVFLNWRKVKKGRTSLTVRYGTVAPAEIQALADAYIQLLSDRDAAKAEASAKSAAAQGLWQSVDVNADGILEEVRSFAPAAYDIPSADAALRASALLRKELAEAEKAAHEARLRVEFQTGQAPQPEDPDAPPLLPPERNREAVTEDLEAVRGGLFALRSSLDRIAGRLHAAGDPLALQAAAERLTDEIALLEGEYAAIELAMSTLAHANTQLQGRFSPALGKRAAEIFNGLTGGAYGGVILDKTLRVSAEPAGTGVPRDVGCLSAGAADQLYLAVRLAVCDLVLPSEHAVPIVLDDALASFDDARCAAALDFLRKEAETRQILLFTCHSREAAHFREDPAVSIQVLTAPGGKV